MNEPPPKPQMKTPVAIELASPDDWLIRFWAEERLARQVMAYGVLYRVDDYDKRWVLTVDRRYDYEEVLAYVAGLAGDA